MNTVVIYGAKFTGLSINRSTDPNFVSIVIGTAKASDNAEICSTGETNVQIVQPNFLTSYLNFQSQ